MKKLQKGGIIKVLFVVPNQSNIYGIKLNPPYPSLGVMYLAACLEKDGHTVELIDMEVAGMELEGLLDYIEAFCPGMVGISCITPTADRGFLIASEIKNRFPEIFTVMGGIHPTIAPDECIDKKGLDIISIGESEGHIGALVSALESKQPLDGIKGIWYKKDGLIHKNEPAELIQNLDSIPYPSFHLIGDLNKYSPPDAQAMPVAPLISSRGCPGNCTYCCTKQIFGKRFRARSVENIVGEIDILVNKYGIKELHFLDDNLSTDRKRLLELCSCLKERNYPIRYELANGIRADMVNREVLQALKDIGMVNIGFGVESGNDEILRVIRKGITKDQVRAKMALAKEMGFETWAFFIVGLYKENAKTIRDTIDFAIELDPDFAKFLVLKPFPGSEIFKQLQDAGLIDSYDYSRYSLYTDPVHHLEELSADEILKWQKKAFRMFYFRPRKIVSHLLRIKSLTQLKIAAKGAAFVLYRIFNRDK